MTILMLSFYLLSVGWPLAPQDSMHACCDYYAAYREGSGGDIDLHTSIDVWCDTSGVPVYAVADGYVKVWVNTWGGSPYGWGLGIGDEYGTDSMNVWSYWHLNSTMYHLEAGDTCSAGELIGYIVHWFDTGQPVRFHHVDLGRRRSAYPWTSALVIQNPLVLVAPNTDTLDPVFEDAHATGRFAFCRDNTSDYLDPDSLHGDVDIIALIHDLTGYPTAWPEWDRLTPYKIEYRIHGPDTIPTIRMMEFSGLLNWDSLSAVTIYKNDAVCNSSGPYYAKDFYFIVTNTDGDTLIEPSDSAGCWQTDSCEDGTYWVVVTAYDICGNMQSDSMQVTVQNGPGVEEWPIAKPIEHDDNITATIFYGPLQLPEDRKCIIYDIAGRVVESDKLQPGIYFIEVDGVVTQKVVKIR
ncbi:hypothetical protein AMJ83_11595 [candidate division WOR_3 bacterium SM23_42]|uniref:Uncharacterized protein n=1 Tax=candidate division WOR_3 bacterium SM23_42 TaxID=1703779 RepID=A0A0S8FPU6_UNCW3|nr:MAG: hypothetical protein AMJ83_11595 [candidate division WOR_3 bacterium SM23_42]